MSAKVNSGPFSRWTILLVADCRVPPPWPCPSSEEFDSELERLNISLVLENQSLQTENRQLSGLLKDYEGTLDAVMAKFRAHAVSLTLRTTPRPARSSSGLLILPLLHSTPLSSTIST